MDVEIGRHGLLDLRQEFAEFDRAVALVAAPDDPTGDDVQGGKQRGRAVALVVMAASLGLPRAHRQQRLGAVERLDLRLFIDAQHQSAVGRVEIEPNGVAHFVDKQRVGRQLEGFDTVRLQSRPARCAPRSGSRCRCAAPCCGCSSARLWTAGSPAFAR
jgi:hypothetical protein